MKGGATGGEAAFTSPCANGRDVEMLEAVDRRTGPLEPINRASSALPLSLIE